MQQQQQAIIDAMYCVPHPVTLTLREEVSFSGDDFTAFDSSGRLWFKMDTKSFSLRQRRTLIDATGKVACSVQKHAFSLHNSWSLFRGSDASPASLIATTKKKFFSLKPHVKVYLASGNTGNGGIQEKASYVVRGDFLARSFTILRVDGGIETVVAESKKQSMFSSATQLFMQSQMNVQTYDVNIQPGVDTCFIVGLCCLMDEIYRDQNN